MFDKRDQRPEDEDDGHTIADMSMLDDRPSFRSVLGGPRKAAPEQPRQDDRPWEKAPLTRKERLMIVLGALKATLLIAAAYILGLGLVVWLFLHFWR